MAAGDAQDAVATSPPIPQRGLNAVCATWTGRGQLIDAIAAVEDLDVETAWTPAQVRRRALRVLFASVAPELSRLPVTHRAWLEALPAESRRGARRSRSPTGKVDWPRTRLSGWPPKDFVLTHRERRPDTLLIGVLAWVLGQASEMMQASPAPANATEKRALEGLEALVGLRSHRLLAGTERFVPAADDLRAIQRSGPPWRQLGRVAGELRRLNPRRLSELAMLLLAPDPELRWRLFHLAVLGEVLASLDDLGGQITSAGPVGGGDASSASAFMVLLDGERWEVWFEAAGIWADRESRQPYADASTTLLGMTRPLGADVLLIDATTTRALFIECKYSAKTSVVGRAGYHQASTYLLEASERLVPRVVSVTVGPSTVVTGTKLIPISSGYLGFSSPDGISALVRDIVEGTGPYAGTSTPR